MIGLLGPRSAILRFELYSFHFHEFYDQYQRQHHLSIFLKCHFLPDLVSKFTGINTKFIEDIIFKDYPVSCPIRAECIKAAPSLKNLYIRSEA